MKTLLLIAFICVGLAACGGGSSSSSPDSNGNETETGASQTGVFLDSAVVDIGYKTETLEGVTNSSGEFEYATGENVTFFIGDLELPLTAAKGVVTPLDIASSQDTTNPVVVNIIRLLQTLDVDGDATNGITIGEDAKTAATQVDFELPINDFATSTAVTNLVVNSGSSNTALISQNAAIAHFEDTLVEAGEDFVANVNVAGIWTTSDTDNDLLAFVFFADGTYVHIEVDEEVPIDEAGESSGMEWGTYSRDIDTGRLTITEIFNNNGETGLTDFIGQSTLFAQVSGDTLTLQFDDNENDAVDADESLEFSRSASNGLLGVWATSDTDNDLLAFVFFADGTYIHMEVDEEAPIDEAGESSGMEWGSYSRDIDTGRLTITEIFNNNGETGLTDFIGQSTLFAQVSGNTLTLQFDDNENGAIDADESLDFQRK